MSAVWVSVARRTRSILALLLFVVGALLCGLSAVVHWDRRAAFKAIHELFDPDQYWGR